MLVSIQNQLDFAVIPNITVVLDRFLLLQHNRNRTCNWKILNIQRWRNM